MTRSRSNHVDQNPLRNLEGHGRPITRRELLGRGFLTGSAMIAGPSLMGLLGRSTDAYAQVQCAVNNNPVGSLPFICMDLAGGANIAGGNVMVGGAGGQLDALSESGYRTLGLAPNTFGQVDTQLGLVFQADSALLAGIRETASADTLSRVNGTVLCTRSDNDTGNNPHNPMFGINKAGGDGELVTLIGTENTESGGRSRAPDYMVDPTKLPAKVDRPSDATALVDAGRLGEILSAAGDSSALLDAIERLAKLKLDRASEAQMVKELMGCSYTESKASIARFSDPTALDPLADPLINGTIFTAAELNNSRDNIYRKTASVMKLVIEGFAGAGTVEVGGYDYHTGNRTVGETRDREAGRAMGAMLEYAALKQTQLMLYVFSDGSVFSNGNLDNNAGGKGVWTGDRSTTAASMILAYSPAARPAVIQSQLGFFNPDGFINRTASPISDNVPLLVEAVVLNYLALSGQPGMFEQIFPQSGLGAGATLDAHIAFQALA